MAGGIRSRIILARWQLISCGYRSVRDAFIVLDEGGVWLDDDKQFDAVTAYVRKHNNYVVIASVLPANLRARTLNVQRVFDGFKFGLPLWFTPAA